VENYNRCLVFALMLIVINEILLPVMGFSNMADGLDVSDDNKLFFYIIMFAGFWTAALLVAYMDFKAEKSGSRRFIGAYISLIWCVFDLTMIPLGYGIISTLLFICASIISLSLEYSVLHKL